MNPLQHLEENVIHQPEDSSSVDSSSFVRNVIQTMQEKCTTTPPPRSRSKESAGTLPAVDENLALEEPEKIPLENLPPDSSSTPTSRSPTTALLQVRSEKTRMLARSATNALRGGVSVVAKIFIWVAFLILLGSAIGVINVGFHKAIHYSYEWWVTDFIQTQNTKFTKYALRAIGCLLSALFSGFVVTFVVPECAGGGMLAVKYILAADVAVPLKIAVYRFIVTCVYVAFGNTLGIEAPTLHMCSVFSCFLYTIAQNVFGEDVFPRSQRSTIIMIGCAVGIGAAFDTPLGGIIFVMEEFLHGHTGSKSFFFCLTLSVGMGVMVSRMFMGDTSYFETELPEGGKVRSWMLFAVIVGVVGGFTSAIFMRLTIRVKKFYGQLYEFVVTESQEVYVKRVVGLKAIQDGSSSLDDSSSLDGSILECYSAADEGIVGYYIYGPWTRSLFAPQFRPFWAAVVTVILGLLVWDISDMQGIFYDGKKSIAMMMSQDVDPMHSALFFAAKVVASALAIAGDSSGGIFYPSLVIGGAMGSCVGQLAKYVYERADFDKGDVLEEQRYLLLCVLGMMAAFSSITRCPLSAVIVVYEMTNVGKTREDFIFPSLVASMLSYLVSAELQKDDFYVGLIHADDVDQGFLEGDASFSDSSENLFSGSGDVFSWEEGGLPGMGTDDRSGATPSSGGPLGQLEIGSTTATTKHATTSQSSALNEIRGGTNTRRSSAPKMETAKKMDPSGTEFNLFKSNRKTASEVNSSSGGEIGIPVMRVVAPHRRTVQRREKSSHGSVLSSNGQAMARAILKRRTEEIRRESSLRLNKGSPTIPDSRVLRTTIPSKEEQTTTPMNSWNELGLRDNKFVGVVLMEKQTGGVLMM